MKDIDVSKTVAIDVDKNLVETAAKNLYPQQNHNFLMLWFHQKKY